MGTDIDKENSVFKLLTNLCEEFHTSPEDIKSSRSKCYEILLGKRNVKFKKGK